ncbi:MAG: HD domain-containing protein [Candidatus Omnitrophica bacterium]|nr:HD domain-containing protein [Candidatus Omnitrophota bacterium]
MIKKVEVFIKDFVSLLQTAKIYTVDHPKFNQVLQLVFKNLREILSEKEKLTFGFVDDEVAFENEIFFELSKKIKDIIDFFKKRDIEKITFYKDISQEEMINFINYLCIPFEEFKNFDQKNRLNLKYFGIVNITIGELEQKEKEEINDYMDYFKQYDSTLNKILQYFNSVLNQENIDLVELKMVIFYIFENLATRFSNFLRLSIIKKYEMTTFNHLLNVSILAMYFSSKLSFSKEEVHNIGIAALFHDIGKIYISKKIINKDIALSEKEFLYIQRHTVIGAELLLNYINTFGILPVVVAFEHHIGYNRKGYPKLNSNYKPHIASFIISICDVYDALCQRRSYKSSWLAEEIYNFMLKKRGEVFEPYLLDRFFEIMGVWPVGTIVKLSDESIAIVRQQCKDDIFYPIVEIISPEKKGLIDLSQKKELKIKHSLNPLNEAAKYIDLI